MRKAIAGVLLGLGASSIVLALGAAGLLEKPELDLYDWRMRTVATVPPDVSPDIVIVELNDTTLRDLDHVFGRWPWARAAVSLLVDFLNRAPAKVIAIDFAFTEGDRVLRHQLGSTELSGEESDEALAASIAAAPANGTELIDAITARERSQRGPGTRRAEHAESGEAVPGRQRGNREGEEGAAEGARWRRGEGHRLALSGLGGALR